MSGKVFIQKLVPLALLALAAASLSGCVLATVRTLEEDEGAKAGFSGDNYVEGIWESEVLPAYAENAHELTMLLDLIAQDEQAAIDQYGSRSGTGAYSFMVHGEGTIIQYNTESRTGLVTVDLAPEDGTAEVSIIVGPLIKISQRAAVRDAVGFIAYGNFVNQQEFADVANAMGDRILQMLMDEFGVDNADAIREIEPAQLEGKRVTFRGAFTLSSADNIEIVPVQFEVSD
ncbi:MAG: DUF2291 domain-containing protein [Chloroflexi bacterium]|nr:DUF2291 domain-containing protein [Chloroflexota bacterium]